METKRVWVRILRPYYLGIFSSHDIETKIFEYWKWGNNRYMLTISDKIHKTIEDLKLEIESEWGEIIHIEE